jgi:hypothetical protein
MYEYKPSVEHEHNGAPAGHARHRPSGVRWRAGHLALASTRPAQCRIIALVWRQHASGRVVHGVTPMSYPPEEMGKRAGADFPAMI